MKTTVIGAFPKPKYLHSSDWFTKGMVDQIYKTTADEDDVINAIEQTIKTQVDIGIDIITDGEIRRENYIHFFFHILTLTQHLNFRNNQVFENIYFFYFAYKKIYLESYNKDFYKIYNYILYTHYLICLYFFLQI